MLNRSLRCLARIKVNRFHGGFSVPRHAFDVAIEAKAGQVQEEIEQKVSFYRELTSDRPCCVSSEPLETGTCCRLSCMGGLFYFEHPAYCRGSMCCTTTRRLIEHGVALESTVAQPVEAVDTAKA